MKFTGRLVALVLCAVNAHASHTFFTPRQITTDPTFELALTDYNIYHERDAYVVKAKPLIKPQKSLFEQAYDWISSGIAWFIGNASSGSTRANTNIAPYHREHMCQLYIKPFVQHSAFAEKSATYFLPNCKSSVWIRENGTGDIDPLWFKVISPPGTFYSSTYSLRPERVTWGGVITFYANLTHRLWVLLNSAAIGALHSLRPQETARTTLGTIDGFRDMCQALGNSQLTAGKIPCCKTLTKGGLDDIQIKFGYDFFRKKTGHVAAYIVGTIPTGSRPTSEYLFEPLVGSRHGSLGAGLNFDCVMLNRDRYKISLLADAKYRYVFPATERRSFDLCGNGDWSRYLLVATSSSPAAALLGINYFTLPAHVTPRSTVDFWLALNQKIKNWSLEAGYTLWWRQKEHIALSCQPTSLNVGIFSMAGLCDCTLTSANSATINASIANGTVAEDSAFTNLTTDNLNLDSAAHPNALSNKWYLASAYNLSRRRYSALFGIGGSYELAWNNAALNQWALWATIGFSF